MRSGAEGRSRGERGRIAIPGLVIAGAAALLYLPSLHSYLLFHTLAEIFSIIVACGVFMVAWNSREAPQTRSLVYLGIGYLFMAILDLMHTLTYRGVNIIPAGNDYATRLWVAGRYLQAAAGLLFALSFRLKRRIPLTALLAAYAAATAALLLVIFVWDVFPTCFVEGVGVTAFKRLSEYAVSAVLAAALVLLLGQRDGLEPQVRRFIVVSFALTIASELLFTLYLSSYGLFNMLGHYLKVVAFLFIYQALIAHEVRRRLLTIDQLEAARRDLLASEQALRQESASKDKFLSILAHDLRNPMSGVQTLAELLATRYGELSEEERRRFARAIREGTSQSLELMDSLLQWVRCQTGRIPWKPEGLDLHDAVQEALALARPATESKQITLGSSVRPGTTAYADANMVAAVLRNLLSNAVKFTPRGGGITVKAAPEGGMVRLSVTDTGVGMAPEELSRLFRIDVHFSRKGTEAESGNGLGLIVCREFVEKNGGRIQARSAPGEGSRFSFTLPSAASPRPQA
jgi:signal transduction histidine kinase